MILRELVALAPKAQVWIPTTGDPPRMSAFHFWDATPDLNLATWEWPRG